MSESTEGAGRESTLRERLNRLFDVVHPPRRGPYSNAEVSALMEERGLEPVSHVYLWKLRTGQSDNPTMRVLEALASFFGVPAAYWFDDEVAEATAAELEMLVLMRDAKIKSAMFRLSGMSADNQDMVLDLIDTVRKHNELTDGK